MKTKENVQSENMELLIEIFHLRNTLSEIYSQKGPDNSVYLSLSLELKVLVNEYVEEKITMLKDELIEICNEKGFQNKETIETSRKLDNAIIEYQKLMYIG